jgi:hypothetical protein
MEIISVDDYNDFINNSDENLKNIFKNLFIKDVEHKDYNNQLYVRFSKELQNHYFNSLLNDFFIFNNNVIDLNDYIYNKLKDNDFYKNIENILSFIANEMFFYTYFEDTSIFFNQETIKQDKEYEYLSIFNEKKEVMNFINNYKQNKYIINDQNNILSLLDNFFYNLKNDSDFFNEIKTKYLIIEKNNKMFLSDYFIDYFCFIFFIEKKGLSSQEIEYNENFLQNFYILCFDENLFDEI